VKYAPSSYGYEHGRHGKSFGHDNIHGYGDFLADGHNYEVNYSGPKANPIVAKYAPSSYGHDHVYGYYGGKAFGHGNVHGYDVLGNGHNYEVNYSGPKANPIVVKKAPSTYGHDNIHRNGKAAIGYGNVHGYGALADKNVYGHDGIFSGYGYAPVNNGHKGYGAYGYAWELPSAGGMGHIGESKPTEFLYTSGRYIGHGSPYVPYTARYKMSGYHGHH